MGESYSGAPDDDSARCGRLASEPLWLLLGGLRFLRRPEWQESRGSGDPEPAAGGRLASEPLWLLLGGLRFLRRPEWQESRGSGDREPAAGGRRLSAANRLANGSGGQLREEVAAWERRLL